MPPTVLQYTQKGIVTRFCARHPTDTHALFCRSKKKAHRKQTVASIKYFFLHKFSTIQDIPYKYTIFYRHCDKSASISAKTFCK